MNTHSKGKLSILTALVLLLSLLLPVVAAADETNVTRSADAYFLALDENYQSQLWYLPVEGEAELIFTSEIYIDEFAVAPDASQVVYRSMQKLWIKALDDSAPTELATLSNFENVTLVFSPDASHLAWTDGGLWVLDLTGDAPAEQLLVNVQASSMGDEAARHYTTHAFSPDNSELLVDVLLWDNNSAGIIDLATGEFTELAASLHHHLLKLANGSYIFYGNSSVSGEFDIRFAATRADLPNAAPILDLLSIDPTATLYVEQAVEIAPNIVRFIASGFRTAGIPMLFAFDVNIEQQALDGALVDIAFIENSSYAILGQLSPDGRILQQAVDNQIGLVDIASAQTQILQTAPMVSAFQWMPLAPEA